MITHQDQGLLSPSDIAELAGVTRGAVSNWRRRIDDFPERAGGTDAKPLFRRNEVEEWLNARGHQIRRDRGESHAWGLMNTLRGELGVDEATDAFLSIACARKLMLERPDGQETWKNLLSETEPDTYSITRSLGSVAEQELIFLPEGLSHRSLRAIIEAVNSIDAAHLGDIVDAVLERLIRSQIRIGGDYGFVGSRTSALLSNLAVSRPEQDTIYDPACGYGIALIEAAQKGAEKSRLIGHDINKRALRIARQRAILHDVRLQLDHADILAYDPRPDLRADVVIAEPPFGMRMDSVFRMTDARYEFGTPPAKFSEMAWIQHAIAHLTEFGRAYVLTPHGPLFRERQEQEIRMELVRQGCVEAIVALPSKMLPHTAIPLALWVVRRPSEARLREPILFIDASSEELPETMVPRWLAERDERSSVSITEASIMDVLADNAVLMPVHWTSRESTQPETISKELTEGLVELKEASVMFRVSDDILPDLPGISRSRTQTIDDLVKEGLIDLRSGRQTARYADLYPDLQDRVVEASHIRDGEWPAPGARDERMDSGIPDLTQPNDVLVTTMKTIRTRVDTTGGHLPGTGVYRLRITHPEVLRPEYLAIVLKGRWNARLMSGSTIQRAPIRDLEVPLLPIEDQTAVIKAVSAIERIKEQARAMERGASQIQDALLDSVRTGVALFPDPTHSIDDNDNGEAN